MIEGFRDVVRRHWPRLRLRTIIFATLFVVAALPGFGAIFLRVYENTLVRQTEAELVAQGAALAAAAAADWPAAPPGRAAARSGTSDTATAIDLSTTPIRAERVAPAPAPPPTGDATEAGTRIEPVLAATRDTTLASIILLDRDGRIVTGSAERGSYAALPEVAAALAGTPRTVLRRNGDYRAVYRFEWLSRAAAIRIHHARPVVVDGRVVGVLLLSRTARALFRGLYEDRGKIALGILVILLLLVVLSGVLSRGVTLPIERLGAATRAVASGHGSVPQVPATAAIEIQGLYADFATMAAAIDDRSRYLRDIAHAISHEFKTPLAGIRGAIELLQDHGPDMAEADRHRFLANAAADANRLAQLITRLLDLARADMSPAEPGAATDLPTLLARIADAHTAPGFAIDVQLPPALPRAALPEGAFETVLSTLVENSRQAGAGHATITATLADTDRIMVQVTDDGPGIAAADSTRLFEPFFTTKRAAGGTGLGLTVARSLLETHGATIAAIETAQGAAFEIIVPTHA